MMYQTAVNVQAFTTTFTFVPDGQNVAFTINNDNYCDSNTCFLGANFSSGASCEGGFYQGFTDGNSYVNNIFALMFDSYGVEPAGGGTFTYSNAQIYDMQQSPCNPTSGGSNPYWGTNKLSTSPVPLNSPASSQDTTTGHTYSATLTYDGTNLELSLYDVTAGGSCPGASCFTQTWSAVDIPALVHGNTAYIGFTASTGEASVAPLYIGSWSYKVNTAPSLPSLSTYTTQSYMGGQTPAASVSFSPVAGSYSGTQSVTLSSSTSGANICYVLATPSSTLILPWPNSEGGCQNGTPYSGPVSVSSSQTLYAVAGTTYSGLPSAQTSAAYTIGSGGGTAATPTFSPAAGTYSSAQSVSISDTTSGATIYYTTNGSTPTTSSTRYTGPITVSSTDTLEAIAVAAGDSNSGVASATYTITPVVSTPTFSPAAGTYTSAQSVTISDATSGTTIYYTTNGTTPTTSSTVYTGPITVSSTETLKAIAAVTGDPQRGRLRGLHHNPTPVVSTPTFSPAAGTYTSAQSVSISDATSGATIYYTTNGSTPTTSSTKYTGPITVSSTETLEAIAVATGDTNSAVASAAYTITPVVSTPAFSPASGTYTTAQSVTLSDTTSGATIYYTTNGTAPTTSSTQYTGPITVSSTETIEAMAAATGDTNSAVASATYTITPVVADADLRPRLRDLYHCAVGDHLRCHLGRNHLLHDQRNCAYHVLDQVHRPNCR